MPPNTTRLIRLSLVAIAACAEDIRPEAELDAGLAPDAKITTVRNSDGTYTTRVDASAVATWTALELDSGGEVDAADGWDLAAQRFHIKLNGGVSGAAGAEVATSAETLDAITAAPTDGWRTDAADGVDDGADPDYAFEYGDGWYAYDVQTHVLTPRPITWIVRTSAGAAIALVIDDYYDDVGTSGVFTFHWKSLSPIGT